MEPGPDVLAAPKVARDLFGARWPLAAAYVARLAADGVLRGLIGPRETERLWDRHLLNCAALAPLLPVGTPLAVGDLGSGAGLPGIVVALLRPDLAIDLIEPLERRATFLQETVELLQLDQCQVVRARAEDLVGQRSYDIVMARAVAPLDRLLAWTLPLLRPGGQLLALKGASASAELGAARPVLARLQATDAEVLTMDAGDGASAWVVRVVAGSAPIAPVPIVPGPITPRAKWSAGVRA